MEKTSYKRRTYFLKGSSQLGLILRVYLILLAVMALSGTVFYFVGNRNLTQEFFEAHSVIKTTMQLLLPSLILVNAVGLLGALALVVFFTHSITGPIHRLKTLSGRISEGDLTVEVKFRQGDAIHELSDIINAVIKGLNSRLHGWKRYLLELGGLADELRDSGYPSPAEFDAMKRKLLVAVTKLEEELDRFRF